MMDSIATIYVVGCVIAAMYFNWKDNVLKAIYYLCSAILGYLISKPGGF